MLTILKSNKRSSHGEEYILNDAVYRVLAEPLYPEDILPDYAVRGKKCIYMERSSIASRSIRYVLAVLLRESGF